MKVTTEEKVTGVVVTLNLTEVKCLKALIGNLSTNKIKNILSSGMNDIAVIDTVENLYHELEKVELT